MSRELVGQSVEVVLADDLPAPPHRVVQGQSVEVVLADEFPAPTAHNVVGQSVEVVLAEETLGPQAWLPTYVWNGDFWVPMFPIEGTPHEPHIVARGQSPDGTKWVVRLDDNGALVTEEDV